ncbi:hypothetical protein D3C81_1530490 [compost metagenome]
MARKTLAQRAMVWRLSLLGRLKLPKVRYLFFSTGAGRMPSAFSDGRNGAMVGRKISFSVKWLANVSGGEK